MAVYQSTLITKRESVVDQIPRQEQTETRVALTSYTAAGALADNDIIVLAEIPVDACIPSIRWWSDDLGTTGTFNLGFYPGNLPVTSLVDTLAVDEDAIGTLVDVNAAALANVELRFETLAIDTISKKAWELAGLSARPSYNTFLVAVTMSAATTAAGKMAAAIFYTA